MTHRRGRAAAVLVAGAVVGMSVLGPVLPAEKASAAGKSKDHDTLVVKYAGADRGTAWGKPVMRVNVVPALGGDAISLVVPKQKPTSDVYDPAPVIVNVVKDLKPGDYIKVRIGKFMSQTLVQTMEVYKLKHGEDEPGAYILVKAEETKVGGQDYLGVELKKFEVPQVVLVPNVKDKSGKMVRDADLAARVEKLKSGSVVEVDVEKVGDLFFLRSIRPFGDPVEAEFVKLTELGTVGQPNLRVTVKRLGKTLVLAIPNVKDGAKTISDPKLAEAAKALKPGQTVMITTTHAGQQTYLSLITPVEKPASQPAGGGGG